MKNRHFLDYSCLSDQVWVRSPMVLEMAELASDPIWTNTIFPESFAFSVLVEFVLRRKGEEFMFSMGESTFFPVITESKFWECFTKFSLMFKRIRFELSIWNVVILLSIRRAICFCWGILRGLFPDWSGHRGCFC